MLTFKVVLLGDKSVGKTSIVKRYCENSWNPYQDATIGAAFFSKIIEIDTENGKE